MDTQADTELGRSESAQCREPLLALGARAASLTPTECSSLLAPRHQRRSHWLQTTSALLALQLGWGAWLLPFVFSRLGWGVAGGALTLVTVCTLYSGFLFSRLYVSTPGTVLFGDIGFAAAGALGRNAVYVILYSLNATRCVLLHLATAQSLQHVFPRHYAPSLWQCGAAVLVLTVALGQIRSMARLTWVFAAGTTCQLVAVIAVLIELIMNPDPEAQPAVSEITLDSVLPASVAFMHLVFAFGGQSAFVEIMSAMKLPQEFPKAIAASTALMSCLYVTLGAVGYWSRGDAIEGIIIFSLGNSPRVRFAAACILVQACSQYLVNLNVWTHNLLVLVARSLSGSGDGKSGGHADVQCSGDHCRLRWAAASVFVCFYSYLLSTSVPYFGTLVGLVTSATYLICAYALPAWFTLRLLHDKLGFWEVCLLWSLIPLSVLFSAVGLYGSTMALLADIASRAHGARS